MQEKKTDPQSIPDKLLRYITEDLFRTSQWATYRSDAANFNNAYLFVELVVEKILCEEFIQWTILRNRDH